MTLRLPSKFLDLLILYAATSTTPDLEIFQGITSVEDMRELFGYKTLDTKEAHFSLSEKPIKTYLGFLYILEKVNMQP